MNMQLFLRKDLSKKALLAFSIALISSNTLACGCDSCGFQLPPGLYAGVFGGGGHSGNNNSSQKGVAFFDLDVGGPLWVSAAGTMGGNAGIVGAHIGYGCLSRFCNFFWTPAVELEGYYMRNTQKGQFFNPTARLPEHDFVDKYPMDTGVLLANAIWTYNSCWGVDPYIGLGIGTAIISISGANSTQIRPIEAGVNHFNSGRSDTDWGFAGQVKAGFAINIDKHWRLFAEYRFLYIAATNYSFGATKYPFHAPTTPWTVRLGDLKYNIGAAGIDYSF